ncbi:unnamed protein product, partial [Didymodactylos carnosus]
DYVTLLHEISLDTISDPANEFRIQTIYEHLLTMLLKIPLQNRKSPTLCLLAENNKFLSTKDLHICLDQTDITHLKDKIGIFKVHDRIKKMPNFNYLIEFFNIHRIRQENAILRSTDDSESVDLKQKLTNITPYILKWLRQKHKYSNELLDQTQRKILHVELFEASRLDLFYENNFFCQTNVHITKNRLYFIRPWNCESNIKDIPKKLCEILSLRNFENDMKFLLYNTIEDIDVRFIRDGISLTSQMNSNEENDHNFSMLSKKCFKLFLFFSSEI